LIFFSLNSLKITRSHGANWATKANQSVQHGYWPLVPAAVDSEVDTNQVVQLGLAPMRVIPFSPSGKYDLKPDEPPHQHEGAIPTTP
jgi:hypothetical protein